MLHKDLQRLVYLVGLVLVALAVAFALLHS